MEGKPLTVAGVQAENEVRLPGMPKVKRGWRRVVNAERILNATSPLLLLIVWELMSRSGVLDVRFFPPPSSIVSTFIKLIGNGSLLSNTEISLMRIFGGFLLGAIPGVIIGIWMGLSRLVRAFVSPMVYATLPIPKVAIYPLIMLIFGLNDTSKIVVIGISTFYLIVINTVTGVLGIEQIYLDVAKNFGANRIDLYRRVVFPGALPTIFAAIKIALSLALIVVVSVEFLNPKSGIGALIWDGWQTFVMSQLYVGLVTISVVGYLITLAVEEIEHLLLPWRRK